MKKNKLLCLLLLGAIFVIGLCAPAFAADGEVDVDFGDIIGDSTASGTCGDELAWNLDRHGVLTIDGNGEMDDFSEDELPWANHTNFIKTIIVGNGVSGIGENAFCGMSVENVKIPSCVISIGEGAFDGLDNDLTIYVNDNSYAKTYAEENDISYKFIGDIDSTDSVDLDDAIFLLQHSLFPDEYPVADYSLSVDLNMDDSIDLDDAILLLQHSLFPDEYPI